MRDAVILLVITAIVAIPVHVHRKANSLAGMDLGIRSPYLKENKSKAMVLLHLLTQNYITTTTTTATTITKTKTAFTYVNIFKLKMTATIRKTSRNLPNRCHGNERPPESLE